MRFTEQWLQNPLEVLTKNSGIKMWDTDAVVNRDGVLSFCMSPGSANVVAARLLLGKNDFGFGITLMSDTVFSGIQTHYEIPPVELEFYNIFITDERPNRAALHLHGNDEPIAEMLKDPAMIITWSLCEFINRKVSQ